MDFIKVWISLVYVCVFWFCQAAPVTVIFLFGPLLLSAIAGGGEQGSFMEIAVINGLFLAGSLGALGVIGKISHRAIAVGTFAIMALMFAILIFYSSLNLYLVGICFGIYALAYSLQSVLDFVYPADFFRPQVMAAAVGILTAVSRAGSALCAFVVPALLSDWGAGGIFTIGTLILLAGLLASWKFKPTAE